MSEKVEIISSSPSHCCIPISQTTLLVSGNNQVQLLDLPTKTEAKKEICPGFNLKIVADLEKNCFYVASTQGLRKFSLSDLKPVDFFQEKSKIGPLVVLEKSRQVLFAIGNFLYRLELDTNRVIEFKGYQANSILSIAFSTDEAFIFTTGGDKTLKKWSSKNRELVNSIKLAHSGSSVCFWEDWNSILVGGSDGSVTEFSSVSFELIRSEKTHSATVSALIRISSDIVISASFDGFVKFPFSARTPIKVASFNIFDMVLLNSSHLVCSCGPKGLRIVRISSLLDQNGDNAFGSNASCTSIIRIRPNFQKVKYRNLFQAKKSGSHLQFQYNSSVLNGLVIFFLPTISALQRSHYSNDSEKGIRKIYHRDYLIYRRADSKDKAQSEGKMFIFSRKIQVFGKFLDDDDDPLVDFRAQFITKGPWLFELNRESSVLPNELKGEAKVSLMNGWLTCFVLDGEVLLKEGFKSQIEVDGVVKNVITIGLNGDLCTSDRISYKIDFLSNKIRLINPF